MKLQGVIFDLDGVITDTAHLHFRAWQQIAAEIGISIDAQFNESLKGISRDESLRRILQHGAKRATLTRRRGRNWRIAKSALCPLTTRVDGQRCSTRHSLLLADPRAQQISVGLASVSLNAPTILAALELREFFTFCADASQLKTRNRTRKSFSPPVQGWACRRRHVSALKMRRRALTPLTPAVCARWGSARA